MCIYVQLYMCVCTQILTLNGRCESILNTRTSKECQIKKCSNSEFGKFNIRYTIISALRIAWILRDNDFIKIIERKQTLIAFLSSAKNTKNNWCLQIEQLFQVHKTLWLMLIKYKAKRYLYIML